MAADKNYFDDFYKAPDPWNYRTCPADLERKARILSAVRLYQPIGPSMEHLNFERALDVACGEGWITQDLPAKELWGYEISDVAACRFPPSVNRIVDLGFAPRALGKVFDLVLVTGALYDHYDSMELLNIVKSAASSLVVTCHIKDWEIKEIVSIGNEIDHIEFPYLRPEHNYTQVLRVFRV